MGFELDFYNIECFADQSLAIIQCGHQTCFPGHVSPSRLYDNYSVTFILEGKGTYRIGSQEYEIHAGQGFVILPNIPISYQADDAQPWRYIYAIFRGLDSETLLRNAGIGSNSVVFDFPMDESMLNNLYAMHRASASCASKGYDVTGYFLLAMSRLIQACDATSKKVENAEQYFARAVTYIEDHYSYNITVDDVAHSVNVDRTYLYRIFMQRAGISPARYLQERRLKKALELMSQEGVTLGEIAVSVGFYDLSHFNRMFTAHFGVSPGQYRRDLQDKPEKPEKPTEEESSHVQSLHDHIGTQIPNYLL